MTTTDHAAIARYLIDGWDEHPKLTLEQRIALAQVHATLALFETFKR